MEQGVSVLIVTHNRREELKKTLSVLFCQQCSLPWEIIVVDQASTDETVQLPELQHERVSFFRLEENLGPPGGRNYAAAQAKYELLFFLDDDAHPMDTDTLERICGHFEAYPRCAIAAFRILNLEGELYYVPRARPGALKTGTEFLCKNFLGGGCSVRKSFFERVGGFSGQLFFWGEETELALKSVKDGSYPVRYNGHIRILHRVHGMGRKGTAQRSFYRNRNRLFLIHEYYPGFAACFASGWYRLRYLADALATGQLKEYVSGIQAEKKMDKSGQYRLTLRELWCYTSIRGNNSGETE